MESSLFDAIDEKHILAAIQEIDRNGVRPGRQSTTYDLLYKDKPYPPKFVLSLASKFATGKELEPNEFEGGMETEGYKYLERFDFTIVKKLRKSFTAEDFTEGLYAYLDTLHENLSKVIEIGDWIFEGKSDFAFGTPIGSWKEPGFRFVGKDSSFIIRSVSKAKNGSNYLVVESYRLGGQLANVNLDNSDKFENNNGRVIIYETFDMTVGLGRRSREDVRNAFAQFSDSDVEIITSFQETEVNWPDIIRQILRWAILREKAKEFLRQDATKKLQESGNHFWILRIYGDNWGVKDLRSGSECYFHTHTEGNLRGQDYPMFQQVGVGDFGVAYDFSSDRGFAFIFEVTEKLHSDKVMGEIISFKVAYLVQPHYRIDQDTSIGRISSMLDESSVKLIPIEASEFETLADSFSHQVIAADEPKNFISEVFSDGVGKEIKDELKIMDDVNALASVICYKQVKPPLAIGLFGNWGSGKSFFMNKLEDRIDYLAKDKSGLFCRKTLCITFNSWHYSDSNLWASLITKIFEELEKQGKDDPEDVKKIFKELHSTKEILDDKKVEQEKVAKDIEELKGVKRLKETEINFNADKLRGISGRDIIKAVMENPDVKEQIGRVKSEYSFIKMDEYQEIENNIHALGDFRTKVIDVFKIAYSVKSGKGWKAILYFVLIGGVIWLLLNNSKLAGTWFSENKYLITGFSVAFSQFMIMIKPAITRVTKLLGWLKSIRDTISVLRKQSSDKSESEIDSIQETINEAEKQKEGIQQQVEVLSIALARIESDIDDISSGKRIIKFIETKVSDERYVNSLGIISWVRKDFEQLDRLFRQQREAREKALAAGDPLPAGYHLERITLFIDDLDRCSEEIVVKVLEAIHLLLAFPLFVVIVGVDPRWMHRALSSHHARFINDVDKPGDNRATSYDYLEKIFQIPFVLKEMSQEGKSKLIRSQMKNMLAVKDEVPLIANTAVTGIPGTTAPSSIANPLPATTPVTVSSEQGNKNEESVRPETLTISESEVVLIEFIADLIGNSPRTIKRYTNIYRIIRTHAKFTIRKGEEAEFHSAAIVLLAVVTGLPESVNPFFNALRTIKPEETFLQFIEREIGPGSLFGSSKLFTLKELITYTEYDELFSRIKKEHLVENMALIKRFSFHEIS